MRMMCHDPRRSENRDEKVETDNPVLVGIELIRREQPTAKIDWADVVRAADHCDEVVDCLLQAGV